MAFWVHPTTSGNRVIRTTYYNVLIFCLKVDGFGLKQDLNDMIILDSCVFIYYLQNTDTMTPHKQCLFTQQSHLCISAGHARPPLQEQTTYPQRLLTKSYSESSPTMGVPCCGSEFLKPPPGLFR